MRGMALFLVRLAMLMLPLVVAEAAPITFASGANAIPAVVSSGTGHLTAGLNPTAQTLLFKVVFRFN